MKPFAWQYMVISACVWYMSGCTLSTAHPSARVASPAYASPQTHTSATAFTKRQRFRQAVAEVVARIKRDPYYKKIGFSSPEEKQWFNALLYRLWSGEISKERFIALGTQRYPAKRYEFAFVADVMPQDSYR